MEEYDIGEEKEKMFVVELCVALRQRNDMYL